MSPSLRPSRRPALLVRVVRAVRRLLRDAALRLEPRTGRRVAGVLTRMRLADNLGPAHDAGLALELERARRAYLAGDLARARRLVDGVAAVVPREPAVVALRRDIVEAQGDLPELARYQVAVWFADRSHGQAGTALRHTLGRILVTTPGWLPRIPGPPRPFDPVPGTVLYLGDERAGVGGGAVASDPRGVRIAHACARELLAAGSPRDVAVDRRLAHEAWLTARLARRVRPAVIHVTPGASAEQALVGLAVAAHTRRPLVYEMRAAAGAPAGRDDRAADDARTEFELETSVLLAADHVVAPTAEARDAVVRRGVPGERVTIVPPGPAETRATILADVYGVLATTSHAPASAT